MSFRALQATKSTITAHSDHSVLLPVDHPESIRRRKFRHGFEHLIRVCISIGGYSVIAAIVLIFFFLLLQILPLMQGADITKEVSFKLADQAANVGTESTTMPIHLSLDEKGEIAAQFFSDGQVHFFDSRSGQLLLKTIVSRPEGAKVSSFSASNTVSGLIVYGLDNGQAVIARHQYQINYLDEKRLITPVLEYPFGTTPISIDSELHALEKIALEKSDDKLSIVAWTDDRRLLQKQVNLGLAKFAMSQKENQVTNIEDFQFKVDGSTSSNHLSGAVLLSETSQILNTQKIKAEDKIEFLFLSQAHDSLFLIVKNKQNESWLHYYNLKANGHFDNVQTVLLSQPEAAVTTAQLLAGGISLLVGKQNGEISQWFPVNIENIGFQITEIRRFSTQKHAITKIVSEPERKGFLAIDVSGQVGIYHTTSHSNLLLEKVSEQAFTQLALNKRADYFIAQSADKSWSFWSIDNEYPEVSWQTLWGKVWYENYSEPEYIWQSSSSSNDFEPKFSLTPLALGTLKAAIYAMLFAVPLAIMGAIYTAYFMNARMRNVVKPTIEIMEALPTVIIGFLAGLWLAPFVDVHLFAVLSLLFILPVGVLLSAWLWHFFELDSVWKNSFKTTFPEGWEALILIPVIAALAWAVVSVASPIEHWLFSGTMQNWLSNKLGITFDQRNSIIVGIAMGFAIIPTIFSITEDAIFNVPRHLSTGSMALGATRWQTLMRVVILTASPAIFSAIMIGLGRAIGETMIVLMATGNTPIMDFSIFQGMRTLSANIAIEIPESEIGSSHYRILFLAAFILFLFTFFFNTIAEIVRQRLRRNYSKL